MVLDAKRLMQLLPSLPALPSRRDALAIFAGPGGAGKTTIAAAYAREHNATLVSQDLFLFDEKDRLGPGLAQKYDMVSFVRAVEALARGEPVQIVPFDVERRRRHGTLLLEPRPGGIVVEGVTVLQPWRIRRLAALSFFVTAAPADRAARQLLRHSHENWYRGWTLERLLQRILTNLQLEPIIMRQADLALYILDTTNDPPVLARRRPRRLGRSRVHSSRHRRRAVVVIGR